MTKWEEDLAPYEPISGWRVFFVIACLLLGVLFSIWVVAGSAHGEEALKCDFSESLLIDALKDKSDWPDRTYVVLEGHALQEFISKAQAKGYISGTLYATDKIYIIDAKYEHGTKPKVWIYFVGNGCIFAKLVADKPEVEALL